MKIAILTICFIAIFTLVGLASAKGLAYGIKNKTLIGEGLILPAHKVYSPYDIQRANSSETLALWEHYGHEMYDGPDFKFQYPEDFLLEENNVTFINRHRVGEDDVYRTYPVQHSVTLCGLAKAEHHDDCPVVGTLYVYNMTTVKNLTDGELYKLGTGERCYEHYTAESTEHVYNKNIVIQDVKSLIANEEACPPFTLSIIKRNKLVFALTTNIGGCKELRVSNLLNIEKRAASDYAITFLSTLSF